jgi:hypothetical protein
MVPIPVLVTGISEVINVTNPASLASSSRIFFTPNVRNFRKKVTYVIIIKCEAVTMLNVAHLFQ